jgi:GT2 family glycosyltransferase
MTLVLPDPREPAFSVVIVTHGSWSLTNRALAALTAHTPPVFELIVVDNDSKDETRAQLAALQNVRVILNDKNEGLGPAVNRGAADARAEQLLLLNSDAFVEPGWLDPLLETMRDPTVGAVVPQFLHLDGSLQEAGALLAQDGTVFVYGDGDDPNHLCYRFRRVVDSGGAACMLLRRSVFELLGGFDPVYAPAYYDDADLCLRIAQNGLDVVYQPRSTVTHVRYGSGGSETAAELSERNRPLFVSRWASDLVGRPWTFRGSSKQAVITARDALATPRVLLAAGPAEPGVAELAHMMIERWPRARVTWATRLDRGAGFDPDPWLATGIEVLDQTDASWISDRLFHYDLAVLGSQTDEPFLTALSRTQPQAKSLSLAELDGPLETRLDCLLGTAASAGIA